VPKTTAPPADRSIAIIGLGYVGLPLAVSLAEAGCQVRGLDIWAQRVGEINAGHSPIEDISSRRVSDLVSSGALRATEPRAGALSGAEVVFVCVPTPTTSDHVPDLGPVMSAASFIGSELQAGMLVVLQSTTYPGTTNGPFRAALESASGLRAGIDFDLAFAPERINPGDPASAGPAIPRLVGGTSPEATARTVRLFSLINHQVLGLSSAEAAEAAKLLENTFRLINISFINEFARMCEHIGLDAWEVIDAAATKPFGFMRFTPGPGVGGHCIPVDPHYLAWRARDSGFSERFISLAAAINDEQPRHIVDLAVAELARRGSILAGRRVLLAGASFKPNVSDTRNSPSSAVASILRGFRAQVAYSDPRVGSFRDNEGQPVPAFPLSEGLDWADLVIVMVNHDDFDWDLIYAGDRPIIDAVGSSRGRPGSAVRLGDGT